MLVPHCPGFSYRHKEDRQVFTRGYNVVTILWHCSVGLQQILSVDVTKWWKPEIFKITTKIKYEPTNFMFASTI